MTKLVFRAVLAALSAGLLYLGICLNRSDFMLWGVYCATGSNFVYAIPARPVFLLVQISFFLILLASPGLKALKGTGWWPSDAAFSPVPLIALAVSLLSMQAGDMLLGRILGRTGRGRPGRGGLREWVKKVSLLFLGLAFCCSIARFYLRYPLLDAFSSLTGAFFCIYLATMPNTGGIYLAIGFFLIPAIPGLFGAGVSTFMLRLLLCAGYLFLRRYPVWQGLGLLLGLPLALWGVELLRSQAGLSAAWLTQSFENFIFQIGQGFEAVVQAMPQRASGSTRVAEAIFSALNPQALLRVLTGETLSTASGLGPFLADCFSDWGYLGIALYSAGVGCCLAMVEWGKGRHYMGFAFLLMALSGLLALPGGTVLSPVEFLFNPMTYLAFMLCMLSALLCRAFSGGSRRRT